ncbi:MAG TPA: hydroxyethylthiazole kinase [Pseudolabrys sp.]|nr:hydroxyethylthiazole kinase [Pseudolabrys sp.]
MHHPEATSRSGLSREDLARAASGILARLRAEKPRIHCITNAVAQNFTANVLLAAGCTPSMTLSPAEIGPFVASAQGLLVNLGTFDAERREATKVAVETATREKVPWVLDPVFVDRAPLRAAFARELVGARPSVVRLNHAEFVTLGGESSREKLMIYATARRTVVALSGETDIITDGERIAAVANGHPLMAKITAMGCAGSALVAACLAVEPDAFRAAVAALAIVGVAGEIAGGGSAGPGSFAVAIVDTLHNLDGRALAARLKVS